MVEWKEGWENGMEKWKEGWENGIEKWKEGWENEMLKWKEGWENGMFKWKEGWKNGMEKWKEGWENGMEKWKEGWENGIEKWKGRWECIVTSWTEDSTSLILSLQCIHPSSCSIFPLFNYLSICEYVYLSTYAYISVQEGTKLTKEYILPLPWRPRPENQSVGNGKDFFLSPSTLTPPLLLFALWPLPPDVV